MLILTRKPGESLYIGDSVKITIVEIKGNQIRVGIDAPTDLRIYREEIYMQILEENRTAAEGVMSGNALDQLTGGWKGRSGAESYEGGSLKSTKRVVTDSRGKDQSKDAFVESHKKHTKTPGDNTDNFRGRPQHEGGKE